MPFKLDPESVKKIHKEVSNAFPLPFPEIWERMNLPINEVVKIMQEHIQQVHKAGGIDAVLEFRDECERERNQVQDRLDKDLPDDDRIHLETVIHYFDMFIAQINSMKVSLINKPTYKDMKHYLKKFYSENEIKMWDEFKTGKGIADHFVNHLKEKFPDAEKYPDESTIRKDWLELTD